MDIVHSIGVRSNRCGLQRAFPADWLVRPTFSNYSRLTVAVQEAFLDQLRQLAPDLCVTAAYGNILPRGFLDIPRHGTLNIHPSLLPRWRGAAPVPRCLEVCLKWALRHLICAAGGDGR